MSISVTFLAKELHPVRVIIHESDGSICADAGGQFIGEVLRAVDKPGANRIICQHGKEAAIRSVDIVVPEIVK